MPHIARQAFLHGAIAILPLSLAVAPWGLLAGYVRREQPSYGEGVTSGVNVALVGRWFAGLTRGRLAHADIHASSPQPGERGLGWAFHFIVGGGGVALIYPAVLMSLDIEPLSHPWLGGLVFGLATSLLPWLVLLPAFGWGWFGRRGPQQ